jgi:hypothetical protein
MRIELACLTWNLQEYATASEGDVEYIFAVISDFHKQNEDTDLLISFQGVSAWTHTNLEAHLHSTYGDWAISHFVAHQVAANDFKANYDRSAIETATDFGNMLALIPCGQGPLASGCTVECSSYAFACAVPFLRIEFADDTSLQLVGVHLALDETGQCLQLHSLLSEAEAEIVIVAGLTNAPGYHFPGQLREPPATFPSSYPIWAMSDIWVHGVDQTHSAEAIRILYIEETSEYLPLSRKIEIGPQPRGHDDICLIN